MSNIEQMNEQQLRSELEKLARNCNAVGVRVLAYQEMQQRSADVIEQILKHAIEHGSISVAELRPIIRQYSLEMQGKIAKLPTLEVDDEVDM